MWTAPESDKILIKLYNLKIRQKLKIKMFHVNIIKTSPISVLQTCFSHQGLTEKRRQTRQQVFFHNRHFNLFEFSTAENAQVLKCPKTNDSEPVLLLFYFEILCPVFLCVASHTCVSFPHLTSVFSHHPLCLMFLSSLPASSVNDLLLYRCGPCTEAA